jgi:hypothetical protein
MDDEATEVRWYNCPMKPQLGCQVQIKVIESANITLLQRCKHDENSHSHDKDKSKHLKVKQLEAIRTGVRMSPAQSPNSRNNLIDFSPEMQVDP